MLVGYTTADGSIDLGDGPVAIEAYRQRWEDKLEGVFATRAGTAESVPAILYDQRSDRAPAYKHLRPKAVIPVFPGTNCEYDTARAVDQSGGEPEIIVVRNLSAAALTDTVERIRALAVRELTTDPELLPLEAFLGRAEDYLRANVGVKHVTGYLATYTFDPQEKK